MATHYFLYPWAVAGDLTAGGIPEGATGTGFVSYQQGFTFDYQRDLSSDPQAKSYQRVTTNSFLNDITLVLQQYQQSCAPDWITAAANGGAAFAYDAGATVRYSGSGSPPFAQYVNTVAANTAAPGADGSWLNASQFWQNVQNIRPILIGEVFGPTLLSSHVYSITDNFTAPADGFIDVIAHGFIPGHTDAVFGMAFATVNVTDANTSSDAGVQQFNATAFLTGKVAKNASVTVTVNVTTQSGAINPAYYLGVDFLLKFTPAQRTL